MDVMTITAAALFLFVVVIVFSVMRKLERRRLGPYELLPGLLSQGETAFYRALLAAVSEHYLIVPKVRVADVLKVAGTVPRKQQRGAFNRIAMKHFDFVLCDPRTLEFLGAIELDDKSHGRSERAARDDFLNEAVATAKLPLHRFRARANYVVEDIRDALLPRVADTQLLPRVSRGRIEPSL
jgi:hypothetical protein